MPKTAGRDANHVRLVARTDDGFGTAVMQLPVQHRTVPKEIPRVPPHRRRFGGVRNVRQVIQHPMKLFHSVPFNALVA